MFVQTTIKGPVTFSGVGLHSGARVSMTVRPASANHGIWFHRSDVAARDAMVPAHYLSVSVSKLCTVVQNAAGVQVSTIEHIMAALAGCGIHNALIDIDGSEVPILDGSALAFVSAILSKGVRQLDEPLRCFEVLRAVEIRDGAAFARLEPAETLEIDFRIDFTASAIGRQAKSLALANGAFVRELSDSRTFCLQSDVDAMRSNGLALGGSYDNAVVVEGDRVLTPGGFRHADEAVRHKMLDAMGDLALAGAPIMGRYTGNRAGHAMTNRLLRALFARPDAFRLIEVDHADHLRLPGVGVLRADIPALA